VDRLDGLTDWWVGVQRGLGSARSRSGCSSESLCVGSAQRLVLTAAAALGTIVLVGLFLDSLRAGLT
jgi:hypothetical protein